MPEDLLILLARILGIAGVMLLAASAVLGVLLASRTTQRTRPHEGFRGMKVPSAAALVPSKVSEEGATR